MKINRLEVESFMGIRAVAVDVAADGSMVVVGGHNAQGKSSLLRALEVLLEGMAVCPDEPVRRGAKQATITAFLSGDQLRPGAGVVGHSGSAIEVGDLVIKRTIKPNKSTTFTVTEKKRDGQVAVSKPQQLVDRLLARSFRPMEFLSLKPAEQLDRLRRLVGLDFRDLDDRRAQLYAERTRVNAEAASLKARAEAMPFYKDAPDDPLPLHDIAAMRSGVLAKVRENDRLRGLAKQEAENVRRSEAKLAAAQADVDRIKKMLEAALLAVDREAEDYKLAVLRAKDARDGADGLVDPDLQEIDEEEIRRRKLNGQVEENARRQVRLVEASDKAAESDDLTERIRAIDDEKETRLAGAKFPVAGLGFGVAGVTLNGLPFEQGSKAERMAASIAIGMSESPKPVINVWIVEDGMLMDPPVLADLAEKAAAVGAQIFVEVNKVGEGVTIEIEAGEVAGG